MLRVMRSFAFLLDFQLPVNIIASSYAIQLRD